ncbi:MAG TPA: ArsI/CadI family heavy metal resistance metalloenzyme [Myxococcota bacterium]|nr:ArsI/CadI family heavy metal resistance metalloenzyme [Myxococcota bacterium]
MSNAFHVSLNVRSIPEAVERYRKILGAEPAKVRDDYAKFELADPPVVLSLNLGGEPGTVGHLGIRRPDSDSVAAELRRSADVSLEPFSQEGVTCCYAKADKFWVRDADGMAWEMYSFIADAETHSKPAPAPAAAAVKSGCCAA